MKVQEVIEYLEGLIKGGAVNSDKSFVLLDCERDWGGYVTYFSYSVPQDCFYVDYEPVRSQWSGPPRKITAPLTVGIVLRLLKSLVKGSYVDVEDPLRLAYESRPSAQDEVSSLILSPYRHYFYVTLGGPSEPPNYPVVAVENQNIED